MSIVIIGTHFIHQTIFLDKARLDLSNQIEDVVESFDSPLLYLTETFNEHGLETHLIANFSSSPKYMLPLSRLEVKNIKVYPDLQDETPMHITLQTNKNKIEIEPKPQLNIQDYQLKILEAADYIISNLTSFEMLKLISAHASQNIILYDTLPAYDAMGFVQGIVFKEKPDNYGNLVQNGLSWICFPTERGIIFKTSKHAITLDFNSVDDMLMDFITVKDIPAWLIKHKI